MNKSLLPLLISFFLTSCDFWGVAPQPFPIQTPIPTNTPAIFTATPFIIPPPVITITGLSGTAFTSATPIWTETPPPSPTFTPDSPTPTFTQPTVQSVAVEILGCNTSFDIRNGMGEVTNAFVVVKNTGTLDLPNTCGLLRAIDEGREHPDKKSCLGNLPFNHQVTFKLTVDSTYKQDTIIQVDVTTNETILLRVDKQSCRDISLFGGVPADIGMPKPIP